MRLTKLEINGFKSFAKKTELVFDTGITAVIGPNGSGKSNIADSVRWVLGEQSAKALRGERMEDIIFNGTQERRPQAYCEVQLTFDNTDGALPIDFAEVTVGRRVYRSGESEYAINRNACRLKDVQELFRDTGIGKEGYSIIGQGKVEEILSNRSHDRRMVLEEAAGVARYRVRKEEAVRKLEHTGKNLERLMDILNELELQRDPLKEQAETARTYLQYREELRHLDINVFLHQYERTTERVKNAQAAIAQLTTEAESLEEQDHILAADCAAQEEQLRNIEHEASVLQNQLLAEMSVVEAHAGEAKVLRERKTNLEREFERLQQELRQDKEKRDALRGQMQSISVADNKEVLAALDAEIRADEERLQARQKEIDEQEQLVERQKNSIIEQLNRLSDAKSQVSRMEAMENAFHQRMDALQKEQEEILREKDSLEKEHTAANLEAEKEEARRHELGEQLTALANATQEAAKKSKEADQEQRALEQKIQAMRSRVNVLDEMARAHEGYYASVRNVLRDSENDYALKKSILGVVAELIQVPEKFETALEMSLGAALQNIITPTPEDAQRVIEHLRKHQYGRATMLPVSAMRPRLLTQEERACLNIKGCLGVASELVTFDKQYSSVVDNLLGRTVLVEDLQTGIELNKRAKSAFRIATVQGDIIHPGGSMTGGSVQKREFSLLGRERETKELRGSIKATEAQMERLLQNKQEAEANVENCRIQAAEVESRIHAHEVDAARFKEKLDLILRDIAGNALKWERNETECGQIKDNLADIANERQEIESRQRGMEEGNATTQEDVLRSQSGLNELRAQSEAANTALTERKVYRMGLQKEEDAQQNEQKRLQRELEQIEKHILQAIQLCQKNKTDSEALQQEIASMGENVSDEQAQLDSHKEQHRAIEEERQRRTRSLSETREKRDQALISLREFEERKHKQDLLLNRAEIEFEGMQERILEEYQLTYESALPFRAEQFAVTASHIRIDELRTAIRELGNINVNAVEDYKALQERYEQLQMQCDDLKKAESDLHVLITELTMTMEQKFTEQFQLIQKNFSMVYEQLFGGGRAELRLADPRDVLNCEIDIIAQPPGKKLQLLSLLSGGERALTAIALLFAILRLKPTVFCILDEIETSLDEVNVTRFANYLRAYADDTQFILITHRKGSMEVCNALYGVAMEEKGVSKIVSARLQNQNGVA